MYMSYQTNREAVRAFRFRFTDLSTFVKPPSSVLGRVGPTLYAAEALSLGRVEPAHLDIMNSFLYSNNNPVRGVCWLRSINPCAPVSLILISGELAESIRPRIFSISEKEESIWRTLHLSQCFCKSYFYQIIVFINIVPARFSSCVPINFHKVRTILETLGIIMIKKTSRLIWLLSKDIIFFFWRLCSVIITISS